MFRNLAWIVAIASILLLVQPGDSAPRRRPGASAAPALKKAKGALHVSVLNDAGRHAGRAHIRVIGHVGKRRHVRARRANAGGVMVMRGLAPGQYTVRAFGAHRTHGAATTLVSAGTMTPISIGLHGGIHHTARTLAFIETRIHPGRLTHHLFGLGLPKPHAPATKSATK